MKKSILLLCTVATLMLTNGIEAQAGAPWGEVLPKGISWLKLYYVRTWSSEKFDEESCKEGSFGLLEKDGFIKELLNK